MIQRVTASQYGQSVGQILPTFSLSPLEGGEAVSLDETLASRAGAVVIFWSSICSHCVRYDPYLNGFQASHPDIALLVIASRQSETLAQIRAARTERGLRFPILADAEGQVAAAWFAQQTPRAYLLGPDRTLRYRGAIDNFKYPEDPEFEPYLEPALASFGAGQPIARPETASFGCAITSVYYVMPKMIRRADRG